VQRKEIMSQDPVIVFVCEHGAAKSVISAAYFNKFSAETGLELRAIARGINPDEELSPKAIAGLLADNLTPTELAPQKLSLADVESAQQIITFCELPAEYQQQGNIEYWGDVSPVSEDYQKARDAILELINRLLKELRL
jgi:arsenate reductase (thioredoxin)